MALTPEQTAELQRLRMKAKTAEEDRELCEELEIAALLMKHVPFVERLLHRAIHRIQGGNDGC